jgi:hypothetical protein
MTTKPTYDNNIFNKHEQLNFLAYKLRITSVVQHTLTYYPSSKFQVVCYEDNPYAFENGYFEIS